MYTDSVLVFQQYCDMDVMVMTQSVSLYIREFFQLQLTLNSFLESKKPEKAAKFVHPFGNYDNESFPLTIRFLINACFFDTRN